MASGKFRLAPILLKGPIAKADIGKVKGALRKWGLNMVRHMDDYPQQLPTPYRRTHALGQSWTTSGPHVQGRDVVQEAGSNKTYAGYVEGFGPDAGQPKEKTQTKEMARRNWPRADEAAQEEFDGVLPDIRRALNQL